MRDTDSKIRIIIFPRSACLLWVVWPLKKWGASSLWVHGLLQMRLLAYCEWPCLSQIEAFVSRVFFFYLNPFSHGVPTPMYFKGVLTDGGGAIEFISATSRGRSKNYISRKLTLPPSTLDPVMKGAKFKNIWNALWKFNRIICEKTWWIKKW